jgi:hypothetical protein
MIYYVEDPGFDLKQIQIVDGNNLVYGIPPPYNGQPSHA